MEWTFESLTDEGNNRQQILDKIATHIAAGYYRITDFKIDDDFLKNTFLGFSYLVPNIPNLAAEVAENKQQEFFSSVFRNINLRGATLLPHESRTSLYYLDKDLVDFFDPEFCNHFKLNSGGKADFIRYISLLFQCHYNESAYQVARGYKPKMEEYYEEYISRAVSDEPSEMFGKFSDIFPLKNYKDRFNELQSTIQALEIPTQYTSIIDMDIYLFGLFYTTLIKNKKMDSSKKVALKDELDAKINELKQDPSHTKTPGSLKHLRSRIADSIEIYKKYIQ